MIPSLPSSEEQARLRALAVYDILDTPPEADFDRLTALASRTLRAPMALVSLVAEDRLWFKSAHGVGAQTLPREQSLCESVTVSGQTLVVLDAARHPDFAQTPLVTGPPNIRFYAGAPLLAPAFPASPETPAAAVRLGTFCIIDTLPRAAFDAEETATLQDFAALTVEFLLRRLVNEHHRGEIAGRQRAEAAWRRSEDRYRRIAANPLGMVYQLVRRPDGTYDLPFVGEGCQALCGLSPRAVQREPRLLHRRVLPADRARLRSALQESAHTLQPWRWEGRIRLGDGTTKWVQSHACPERLPDGGTLWDGMVTENSTRPAATRKTFPETACDCTRPV